MAKENVAETKTHILEVARREFFAKGFDGASINAIVDAARVTKPTVYYHFGNKEGLFQALLAESFERCFENRRAALDARLEFGEQVARVVAADFAFCLAQPELVRFVLAQTFALPGETALDLTEIHYRDYGLFYELLERGARSGAIECADLMSAALALQGIIDINIVSYLKMGHEKDFLSEERARAVAEGFLEGFGRRR